MKIEIRLSEAVAKAKGYPFEGIKKYLNSFIPGTPSLFRVWDIQQRKKADGGKVLIFSTTVSQKTRGAK